MLRRLRGLQTAATASKATSTGVAASLPLCKIPEAMRGGLNATAGEQAPGRVSLFGSSRVTSEGKKGRADRGSGVFCFHEHAQGARLLHAGRAACSSAAPPFREVACPPVASGGTPRSNAAAAAAAARPVRRQWQKAVWLFMNGQKTHVQRA